MNRAMLKTIALSALALVTTVWLLPASGQEPRQVKQQGTEIQGRIVRTGSGQFIVETADKKQVTVYTNPQTKYLINNKAVQFNELRVGATVTATYVTEGERFIANNVIVASGETRTTEQAGTTQRTEGTVIEGEIVRVAKDQIVLKTFDGKEVVVFVDPQTKIELNNKVVQLAELRPGANIMVTYDLRDERHLARRIVDMTAVEGEVLRVVGKDQVIVRTPEKKEVIIYVTPETRYMLTPQGGAFTDLQPGAPVNVYYNVRDRRNLASRIFTRRR